MAAAVLVGGQGFQEVFPEHGEGLQQFRPRDDTPDADALGGKRLRGGHPAQMGSRAYRCLPGGPGTQRVARRGKSALCWRCAKVSGDAGGAQGGPRLQAGVSSRPRGLTVPEVGSTPWYPNAQAWCSPCLTGGVQCGEDCLSPVRGKALKGGDSVVLQPPGRKGPSHPPRPRLATSGGGSGDGSRGLAHRREGAPSAGLRRQVAQRVWGAGTAGRGAVTVAEWGAGWRAGWRQSTPRTQTPGARGWSERHLAVSLPSARAGGRGPGGCRHGYRS